MYKIFTTIVYLFVLGNAAAQPNVGTSPLDWAKKKCTDLGFKAGTERFGNCVLQLSRNDEAISNAPKQTAAQAIQLPKSSTPSELKTFKDCDECPEMVVIPAGKFLMGSKEDPFSTQPQSKDEMPQRSVSIKSFSIGRFEVTQDQWYLIMGTMPSFFKGRTLPVEQVSWVDTQEFLKRLSEKTGKNYRLPSEAEWEYAARAETQTKYFFGEDPNATVDFAWSRSNSGNQTHQVGQKKPNAFGLHDIAGNVWEWTNDCWNENYIGAPTDGGSWTSGDCSGRVLRGGSLSDIHQYMTSSFRYRGTAVLRSQERGFRVARDN